MSEVEPEPEVVDEGAVQAEERRRSRVEVAATIVLAVAAVATAWASYQATRWNGEQAKASARANALRFEANREANLADFQTDIDVQTFIQWVDATVAEKPGLADFYRQRFRPEFKPAVDAWLGTNPLSDPGAPPTPFAMPEYQLAAEEKAKRLDSQAEEMSAAVRVNVQRAANYVLAVVLFAVSLFFAGMSTKLSGVGPSTVMVTIGCVLFVATAVWVATFPISLAISTS